MFYECRYPLRYCAKPMIILAVLAALVGCSKKQDQAATSQGQIVGRIGNQVITTQELDTEFRWANLPNDKRKDPQIIRRVLEELATRKYLVERALDAKLDREPTVLLDLLRTREQTLANAFLTRQISAQISALTKADVDKYIANNPAKFAGRKILTIDQISLPGNAVSPALLDATRNLRSLDEVVQKLTELGIGYNRSTGSLPSWELPGELAKSVQSRKPDDVFFVRAGQNGMFFQVKNEIPQPVEGEAAVSLARTLIRNEKLASEASMARVSANLEAKYEGEYAKDMADGNNKVNQ